MQNVTPLGNFQDLTQTSLPVLSDPNESYMVVKVTGVPAAKMAAYMAVAEDLAADAGKPMGVGEITKLATDTQAAIAAGQNVPTKSMKFFSAAAIIAPYFFSGQPVNPFAAFGDAMRIYSLMSAKS